jgi:hypothetical protein
MNYDIIGDVHGHAEELEQLLQKMGYKLKNGIYDHPDERKVVFVGDYIDRGPKIRETLHIVKNMCDSENAYALMGNHEYNAVCFHTKDKENGGYFRAHGFKEIQQHYETLKQFKNFPEEWKLFLNWFKKLPLFIEFDNFRVVHAYWKDEHINWIKNNYNNELTADFLKRATTKYSEEYNIIEETLKGKEVSLENGNSFIDKDGASRTACRFKWWLPLDQRKLKKDVLMHCPKAYGESENTENNEIVYSSEKPVFFGHYWLQGEPVIENPTAICLDYSVAKDGKLIAYQLNTAMANSHPVNVSNLIWLTKGWN